MFTNERVNLPADLAGTVEEFKTLFYNVPNSDWTRVKGFPLPHIIAYELDELILNTPGMSSPEIDDAKIQFAKLLQGVYDYGIDRAYAVMHKIYVPTSEEYAYLMKREFPSEKGCETPMVQGVYDSATDAQRPWFNFCLSKWDDWHKLHPTENGGWDLTIAERKELTAYGKSIAEEWAKLTPEQKECWRRAA